MDGAVPDCETAGKKCLIPPLCEKGRRILAIYSLLRRLSGLVDASTVLAKYHATREDLEILAVVEDEYRKNQPHKNP